METKKLSKLPSPGEGQRVGFIQHLISKLHLSGTKATVVENLYWSVIGKIASLFSSLLVGVIVARYLGPERFGHLSYVISFVFLFQTFALFGLDSIEVREEARGRDDAGKIIGTAFGLKAMLAIVFMAASVCTSWLIDGDAYTTLLVAIYSTTVVFNSFGVIRNYFLAIVQNEYIVKAELVRIVFGICVKLLLLVLDASLTWFVIGYVLDAVLLSSGYVLAYRKKVGDLRCWSFDWGYAMFLIKESFPLLLTSAAVIVYQRIDQVMIGQLIDKEAVGYFSVAGKFVEILIYVPMMLSQTITPILIKSLERSRAEYVIKAQHFMNLSVWLSILASAVLSVSAYWIILFTFGASYLPAVGILQVMSFKAASVALSNTAGAMLVTEGLQRYAIFRDALGCLVCVMLNYALLPRYGALAAAFVSIASNIAAGYLADALIPAYRHLFVCQSRTLLTGWRVLFYFRRFVKG